MKWSPPKHPAFAFNQHAHRLGYRDARAFFAPPALDWENASYRLGYGEALRYMFLEENFPPVLSVRFAEPPRDIAIRMANPELFEEADDE